MLLDCSQPTCDVHRRVVLCCKKEHFCACTCMYVCACVCLCVNGSLWVLSEHNTQPVFPLIELSFFFEKLFISICEKLLLTDLFVTRAEQFVPVLVIRSETHLCQIPFMFSNLIWI